MSVETLSNIQSALSTTFAAELRRQWNRIAVTARELTMKPATGQGGGKQIGWDVLFSGNQANSFGEGSDIAASEYAVDPALPAVLPFGQYRSAWQLSNLELKAAAASPMQAEEIGRIWLERAYDALAKLASRANSDFWQGTGVDASGNPTIIGLPTALDPIAPYASISKVTYPEWAGTVLSISAPLTFDLLYQLDQLIYVASGKTPKVLIAAPDVYRKYANLFEAIKRVFQGPGGELPTYQGGERELAWKGMPVLRDKDMTAGTLAMLNTDDIRIRPLTGLINQDGITVESRMAPSSNGETAEATPIVVDVYPLARTGSAQKWVAEMYIQLQVERPNSSGMIKGIS